ncbi:hypothetical protein MUP77_25610 [Candidatus Bathyarchaeota archaeon]|nr:hypothetical protein [Candidatus Bathyarchaeota archaeon]
MSCVQTLPSAPARIGNNPLIFYRVSILLLVSQHEPMGFGSLAFPEESLYHLPFGTKDAYVREIMAADLDKLANLIRICGFLMQTKVYLFWKKMRMGLNRIFGSVLSSQGCCKHGQCDEDCENHV